MVYWTCEHCKSIIEDDISEEEQENLVTLMPDSDFISICLSCADELCITYPEEVLNAPTNS